MLRVTALLFALAASAVCGIVKPVDYTGHKVLTVYPRCEEDLKLLLSLRNDYSIDLWNEPRAVGVPVMIRVPPELADAVINLLKEKDILFDVVIDDVQRAIVAERVQSTATNFTGNVASFDFGKYHQYSEVVGFLQSLTSSYPNIAKLETIGHSYEKRPIYAVKVTAGDSATKPVILMECGIHAREWSSVATGLYVVNELVTKYETDPVITTLLDTYVFYIINEANPDGYVHTWVQDRMWRKTRSRSNLDYLGVCRGADANRNFDIEHCGVGTSRKPCDGMYCGDAPFSESEARAIRDISLRLSNRTKAYFSIHAFSQLWMTPYGTKKELPPNYSELERIGKIGANALSKRFGTEYIVGSIANVIYEAAGSSVDYVYVKHNVKIAFALELRDTGRYGFFLPTEQILPTCQETWDGLQAAILAL